MKAWLLFILIALTPDLVLAESHVPELVVYTYDTFVSPEGLGPAIFSLFEKKQGCRIRSVANGDGGQLLSRLELDARRKKAVAHLIIGIDQLQWERIKPWTEPWGTWVPKDYDKISPSVRMDRGFLPYDFGVLAFMSDQAMLEEFKVNPPLSLSDLLRSEWKKNLILEDPRTSTPGLSFLLYTRSVFGEDVWNFWRSFRTQWMTLAPGWSAAYHLFLKKEAPLVWSYLSSQSYHEEQGQKRYRAVLFKEGQPIQIEGAAIVKGTAKTEKEKRLAKEFLSFLISSEVQKMIPKKIWMMPVRLGIDLPPSFKNLPQPARAIPLQAKPQEIEESLAQWSRIVSETF